MQYVHEYEERIGKGDKAKRKLVRHIRYQEFQDVSGVELYNGIRFTTEKPQRLHLKGNQFSKDYPDYWEVLAEENGGAFYARFFVKLK